LVLKRRRKPSRPAGRAYKHRHAWRESAAGVAMLTPDLLDAT
jgi:hypothetical protein